MAVNLPEVPDTLIEVNVDDIPQEGNLTFTGLWLKGKEVDYRPGQFWVQFGTGWWISAEELAKETTGFTLLSVPVAGWREVERDNDIEVIQHWVPRDGRWHTYVKEEQ